MSTFEIITLIAVIVLAILGGRARKIVKEANEAARAIAEFIDAVDDGMADNSLSREEIKRIIRTGRKALNETKDVGIAAMEMVALITKRK